jgi:antitoxin CcdA
MRTIDAYSAPRRISSVVWEYPGAKRHTNLSVRGDLIDAARAARLNLSALLERALTDELVRVRWRRWREENAPAIAAYNHHVKQHGPYSFSQVRMRF